MIVGRRRPTAARRATDGRRVTFTPSSDFFGTTTFQYRIRDASNLPDRESEAQVTVNVIGRPVGPGITERGRPATRPPRSPGRPRRPTAPRSTTTRSASATATVSRSATRPGYTWSGLTNGEAVQFSVRAHNSAGWGDWSGPSPAVTPDIEPGRPAAPTVQFADGALIVVVEPAGNEGSAITNYDLQIGGGASNVQRRRRRYVLHAGPGWRTAPSTRSWSGP